MLNIERALNQDRLLRALTGLNQGNRINVAREYT